METPTDNFHDGSSEAPIDQHYVDPCSCFSGAVVPPKLSIAYRFGMLLVSFLSLLMPLLYVALIGATIYGVYWFATEEVPAILRWRLHGRAFLFSLVCIAGPLILGVAAILCLIKPLFAPRGQRNTPYTVNPKDEALLYAFVRQIAHLTSTPLPRHIKLDCRMNASANYENGWKGIFDGKLQLTLGLPLVGILTMRQLAGVIAHEFGHFNQGGAVRLTYIVRSINGWFARVVYERDGWDEWLEEQAMNAEGWVAILVGMGRLGAWMARKVLTMILFIGNSLCSFLMRQMEYDADKFEIQLAGSADFENTMTAMNAGSAIQSKIYKDMWQSWFTYRQVPDNLPVLVWRAFQQLPKQAVSAASQQSWAQEPSWHSTHPTNGQRISIAREMAAPGFFSYEAPATDLFQNFTALSKIVTLAHYTDDLEISIIPEALIKVVPEQS